MILRRDKDLQPEERTFFTAVSDSESAETTYTDKTVEPDKRTCTGSTRSTSTG